MYMELLIPLELFSWGAKERFRDSLIETWEIMDDDPYVDPRDTPYHDYLVDVKKNRSGKTKPVNRTLYKMALYDNIKRGGFCPFKQTRMTCTFHDGEFNIRNGHHRLSMVQHWREPDPLTILLWIPEESGKTDVYM